MLHSLIKNKPRLFVGIIFILIIALSACNTPETPPDVVAVDDGQAEATATPTSTPSITPIATATNTPIPTNTPTPIPTNTPTPTSLAGGGSKIAFEVSKGNIQDLYLIDAEGTTLEPLTTGEAGDRAFFGQWSPDGSQILYRGFNNPFNELWLMSADGSNKQQLTEQFDFANNWINPVGQWSPDGQHIYAVVNYGKQDFVQEYRIYDLADGSFTLMDFFPHRWSPDGLQVLGYSVVDGNWEIYAMNADGTNLRNLTNHPAQDTLMQSWGGTPWSPGGGQILFASDREGSTQLYVMDADGSNVQNVSQTIARIREWLWSPDGEWVYFTSDRSGDYNIWRVRPNGEDQTQLTDLAGDERGLRFSPDGQKIVLMAGGNSQSYAYVMDIDGTNVTRLLNNPGIYVSVPQWSPDGQWVYATVNINNQNVVYLISADGEDSRPLTADMFPANYLISGMPSWQP